VAGKHHDIVSFTDKYKAALHEFFLDISNWRKFKTTYNLQWQQQPFNELSQANIPEQRGIYAFTLEAKGLELPTHGYILYMGITGNTSPDRHLKKRFGEYLANLKTMKGRAAVCYMLEKWDGELQFNFVPLPSPGIDLKQIEDAFLQAVIPPVNKSDLGAEITGAKAAAF
jgi:hypothetical protein